MSDKADLLNIYGISKQLWITRKCVTLPRVASFPYCVLAPFPANAAHAAVFCWLQRVRHTLLIFWAYYLLSNQSAV